MVTVIAPSAAVIVRGSMISHPAFQALAGTSKRQKGPEGEIRKTRKRGVIYFVFLQLYRALRAFCQLSYTLVSAALSTCVCINFK
jgi:hypothetical protein